jgi:competence protein ComEC
MDHRSSALNVLAVAGALAIAIAPVVVLDPGFLLSFGATLGILAGVRTWPFTARTASRAERLLREILGVVLTTVAAEAALLPISALLFGRVTLAGLALNLIAIPLMTVLQAASMAALALSFVPLAAGGAGLAAHLAALGILESARLTDVLPLLARDVVAPAAWLTTLYYSALASALLMGTGRLKTTALACTAVAATVIVASPRWAVQGVAAAASHLRVVILDVGQGDATAVLLPDGRALLVDAGGIAVAGLEAERGGFDVGQRLVVPALRALGVTQLDALAITHGDPDHIGGVPAVLRAFRPPSVWDGVPVPPHPALRAANALADALDIRWRTVQAGDIERIGPVRVRVLHPPLPEWERQRVRNDDSVVLDVRMGEVSIVLPGDIGKEGEQAILPLIEPARVVVLKAPHHGSATSSTAQLLDALRPSAVIFSAGRDNRFGHPAPQVVARYRERGVPCFSTAESGAIFVDTDGTGATVWGWSHPAVRMNLGGALRVPP